MPIKGCPHCGSSDYHCDITTITTHTKQNADGSTNQIQSTNVSMWKCDNTSCGKTFGEPKDLPIKKPHVCTACFWFGIVLLLVALYVIFFSAASSNPLDEKSFFVGLLLFLVSVLMIAAG